MRLLGGSVLMEERTLGAISAEVKYPIVNTNEFTIDTEQVYGLEPWERSVY